MPKTLTEQLEDAERATAEARLAFYAAGGGRLALDHSAELIAARAAYDQAVAAERAISDEIIAQAEASGVIPDYSHD